jgi:hypothetical protein
MRSWIVAWVAIAMMGCGHHSNHGTSTCPDGSQACTSNEMCPLANYCSNGCCVGVLL